MRLITATVLACSLISFATMAQIAPAQLGAPGSQNNLVSYGDADCKPKVPCDSIDASPVAQVGNACLNLHFGYPIGDGFFDEMEDMDKNNCLTAKPNAIPKGAGLQLSPVCCVVPAEDSSETMCTLHCELMPVTPSH